jgi:hypothetical protein
MKLERLQDRGTNTNGRWHNYKYYTIVRSCSVINYILFIYEKIREAGKGQQAGEASSG